MLEKYIDLAASLKDLIGQLENHYRELPSLLADEETALKDGAIDQVNEVAKLKSSIGQDIEIVFNKMNERRHNLAGLIGVEGQAAPQTLSECIDLLEHVGDQSQCDGFESDVLNHTIAGLKRKFEEFNEAMIEVKPLIERNRYLVQNLAINYSESLRFWQEIFNERESSYNAKGRQRQSGSGSTLQIKA